MNNKLEQKRYIDEINKAVFEKGLDKISYSDILVSKNTPKILLDLGLRDLPILFSKSHFYKSIKPYNRKKHYKGLDLYKHIYNIPNIINNPTIILKDIVVNNITKNIENNVKHVGDLLIVSNLIDDNNYPVVLSIKANATKGIYNDVLEENYIITIFGHDNFYSLINIAVDNNFVYYYNNIKAQELNQFSEKLVPQALFTLEPNKIIQCIDYNVNSKFKSVEEIKSALDIRSKIKTKLNSAKEFENKIINNERGI